jgi:hypothetical protein
MSTATVKSVLRPAYNSLQEARERVPSGVWHYTHIKGRMIRFQEHEVLRAGMRLWLVGVVSGVFRVDKITPSGDGESQYVVVETAKNQDLGGLIPHDAYLAS